MVIPVPPGMIRMNLKAPMVALADIMMMILTLQPNVVFVVADLMMVVALVVAMVNLTVAMANVSMDHGHVTVMVTALMAQMKPIVVVAVVPMVNLHVLMDLVSMAHGHVTVMVTAPMAQMKPTVAAHHVKTKVYGIVVMANVSHQVMYVMDQLTPVMQVGVLTVLMAQMKV